VILDRYCKEAIDNPPPIFSHGLPYSFLLPSIDADYSGHLPICLWEMYIYSPW
jgi:hypothetical protein